MSDILQTLWHQQEIAPSQIQMEISAKAKLASGNFLWSLIEWHGAKPFGLKKPCLEKNMLVWKVHACKGLYFDLYYHLQNYISGMGSWKTNFVLWELQFFCMKPVTSLLLNWMPHICTVLVLLVLSFKRWIFDLPFDYCKCSLLLHLASCWHCKREFIFWVPHSEACLK